jgi:hypothetical protein
MCEYSGRLVAWLDQELPDQEATNVEWHVGQCAECREAVSAYQEVSAAFLACYEATIGRTRRSLVWAPAIVGAAAAIIVLAVVLWPQPAERLALHPPPAIHAPATAFLLPSAASAAVHPRHLRASLQPARQVWMVQEPVVQIALPADALFPPGAVPEGFSYIADVRPQP